MQKNSFLFLGLSVLLGLAAVFAHRAYSARPATAA
jgi:hypothetical protein